MSAKVLIVDDEINILSSIKRLLFDEDYEILTTDSPAKAIEIVAENEITVLLTDCMMPVMNGISLMQKVGDISPDTVKIMMTGYADLPLAIESINKCNVFRFVAKPWSDEQLIEVLREGLENYEYRKQARLSEDAKLLSLAQTVELKDLYTRGHCERVGDLAIQLAIKIDLPAKLQREVMIGSWLHDCGKIGVPDAILNSQDSLTVDERDIVDRHSAWGADIARRAMLSEFVVNMIEHHHTRYDGENADIKGEDIPLGARIVAICDVYDALATDRPYRDKLDNIEIIDVLKDMAGTILDPKLLNVFLDILEEKSCEQ